MREEIRKLIQEVYKMGVYAMENDYHPSTINTLTTIELQLKRLLKQEGKNENNNWRFNILCVYVFLAFLWLRNGNDIRATYN